MNSMQLSRTDHNPPSQVDNPLAQAIRTIKAKTRPAIGKNGRGFHRAEDLQSEFDKIGQKLVAQSKAHAKQWDEWYGKGSAVACPEHPGYPLVLDRHASHAKSWKAKENVVVFLPCPLCQANIIATRDRDFLTASGVPENMLHCSFENWTPRNSDDERTLERARAYAKHPEGAFLLLGKDFGVGKTHLAISIMRVIGHGRFLSHTQFVKKLRDRYGNDRLEDIVETTTRVNFLLMDEVGLSSGGRDELPALHMMLNERYGYNRPFVLTSNVNLISELAPVLGERMLDRLKDFAFDARVIKGKSWRGAKRGLTASP